jgi:hypothetical protein
MFPPSPAAFLMGVAVWRLDWSQECNRAQSSTVAQQLPEQPPDDVVLCEIEVHQATAQIKQGC